MSRIDKALWERAKQLAARNYRTDVYEETLSDGQVVYFLRNPELPGCKAQGDSINDALAELDEARVNCIYSLLEDQLSVPEPRSSGTRTAASRNYDVALEQQTFAEGEIVTEEKLDGDLNAVSQPSQRREKFSYSIG